MNHRSVSRQRERAGHKPKPATYPEMKLCSVHLNTARWGITRSVRPMVRMKPQILLSIAVTCNVVGVSIIRQNEHGPVGRPLVLSRQEGRVGASACSGNPVGAIDGLEDERPIPIGIHIAGRYIDAAADPVEPRAVV